MAALVVSVLLWLACMAYLMVLYFGARERKRREMEHRSAVKGRLEALRKTDKARVA